ncbi:Transmembrane protein C17orf113 [Merluccius polli]|uniref:Transmembrane protein C17orf113 n=1 Tax=Merluccius polli TaxID=89951 RepID=A0AA47P5G2_MERPO|nr:Transmembrane protein C17orf113 [Merluccius polli]
MGEHDLLSLKQPSPTRWLSLERAVKGICANWAAVVSELREEEDAKNCPVAKGIRKWLQTYTFTALTHLLTDVLAVVNRMNLVFQKEDVNILSISPVVSMTLASLEDLMNGPRFLSEHLSIISDLDTVLNASCYPGGADSALKSYGQEALESVCDHYGSQTGAADPLVQKERMLRDFLPLKRVLAGSENPSFRESCQLLITSLGEMFPDFKTLAEVALVIPVSSVAAERGFSLQNNFKTAMRSRLSEEKVQNLMTIASAAVPLETFDYAQAGTRFKSMRTRRKKRSYFPPLRRDRLWVGLEGFRGEAPPPAPTSLLPGAVDAVSRCAFLPPHGGWGRGPLAPGVIVDRDGLSSVRPNRVASFRAGIRLTYNWRKGSAAMSATHPTRLETRTKESNARASQRVLRNPAAQ